MEQATLVFTLLVAGLILTPLADKWRVPAPVLTALFGVAVALSPSVPELSYDPEALLTILLPPLLYASARKSSWRQFVTNVKPILLLAVVLVFVTAAGIAMLAAAIHPTLPIASALVLGAIVSPPDAAAVTTIASRLGLPHRLVTILEGEGLFNDVTALTLYQVTVAGVVTGALSFSFVALSFGYSAVVAVGVGVGIAFLAEFFLRWVRRYPHLTAALSVLIPYVAYVPTTELKASGVLAVLACAFVLNARVPDPDDVEGRLVRGPFWSVIETAITAVTFGIVGVELVDVIRSVGVSALGWTWKAAVISLAVILLRAGWMVGVMVVTRWRLKWVGRRIDWRTTVVVAWSGMRGVVTVLIAVALPFTTHTGEPFPGRSQVLYISVVVVIFTLLLQGLTLPWVIRTVGLHEDAEKSAQSLQRVINLAVGAASERLDEETTAQKISPNASSRLRLWLSGLEESLVEEEGDPEGEAAESAQQRREIHVTSESMLAASRSALLRARSQQGYDPAVIDRVLAKLDLNSAARVSVR